jgi:uncharacterized membrane protein
MFLRYLLNRPSPKNADDLKLHRARNPEIADVVEDNICTVLELRRLADRHKTRQDRFADGITRLSGSMGFLFAHAVVFAFWIVVNVGQSPILGFDPYPFGFLTMAVSLEAIFLSTVVMISQNKMQEASDKRAELDLQINLLAEHEITRILRLVDAIADKMGIEEAEDPALEELKAITEPAKLMEEIEARAEQAKQAADEEV